MRGVARFLHKSAVTALKSDSSQGPKLLDTKCGPYVWEATRFVRRLVTAQLLTSSAEGALQEGAFACTFLVKN